MIDRKALPPFLIPILNSVMKKIVKIKNYRARFYLTIFYYTICICTGIILVSLFINPSLLNKFPFHLYFPIPIVSMILFLGVKSTYNFEYDSEGGVLCFKNQDLTRIRNEKRSEFPQQKLVQYQIKKGFLKKEVVLFLKSNRSKSGVVKIKHTISYLTSEELTHLQESLDFALVENGMIFRPTTPQIGFYQLKNVS